MTEIVEIYIRPKEEPAICVKEKNLRIYYADKWIDFRDNEILIHNANDFHEECPQCGFRIKEGELFEHEMEKDE